jgi:hypothetical protein
MGGEIRAWFSISLDAVEVIKKGRSLFGGWFGDDREEKEEILVVTSGVWPFRANEVRTCMLVGRRILDLVFARTGSGEGLSTSGS